MLEQPEKQDMGYTYFIGYVTVIFLILLTVAHVIAAIAGNYPVLGSPIILYSIAIFLTSHLHLSRFEALSKSTTFKLTLMLPIVCVSMMFVRSRLLLTEEFSLVTHLFHYAISLFSGIVVTAVMLFGVYKAVHSLQVMRDAKA